MDDSGILGVDFSSSTGSSCAQLFTCVGGTGATPSLSCTSATFMGESGIIIVICAPFSTVEFAMHLSGLLLNTCASVLSCSGVWFRI